VQVTDRAVAREATELLDRVVDLARFVREGRAILGCEMQCAATAPESADRRAS
jgi:hypothetical protein